MVPIQYILIIILSGCKHAEESEVAPEPEKRIARSWIYSKNPQIPREIREMEELPHDRSFIIHLSGARNPSDSQLSNHLQSHFVNTLMHSEAFSEKLSSYDDCSSLYKEGIDVSKLEMGEMRSTIYNLKDVGIDDVQLLNIMVRAVVPRSDRYIIFESANLVIPLKVDKIRLIDEKGDIMRNLLNSSGVKDPKDALKTYSVIGISAGMMRGIGVHGLSAHNKRMKFAATRARECLFFPDTEGRVPPKSVGIKSDSVFFRD